MRKYKYQFIGVFIVGFILSSLILNKCNTNKPYTLLKDTVEINILKDSINNIITRLDSNAKLISKYRDKIQMLDKINVINIHRYEIQIENLKLHNVSNDSISRYISSKIKNR